jgi:opacity protein-like surface antigen
MKKFAFVFLIVFSVQASYAQEFGASLVVGANFSQVDGDQMGGYNKLGLNSGIAISRKVNNEWTASFEILYAMKGSKKVIDPDNFEPYLKLSYHYVEVPLLARYSFTDKINFFGGPSIGVNVFNQRDDNGIVTSEEGLTTTEIGLHLGGNYKITDKMALELRHAYSLLSVRDYPIIVNGPTWFGRAGWYNRLFTIGIRYDLR